MEESIGARVSIYYPDQQCSSFPVVDRVSLTQAIHQLVRAASDYIPASEVQAALVDVAGFVMTDVGMTNIEAKILSYIRRGCLEAIQAWGEQQKRELGM